jgi:hypothetical protein
VIVAPTGSAEFDIVGGTFFMAGVSSGFSTFGRGDPGILVNGAVSGFAGGSNFPDPLVADFDFFGFPVDSYTNSTGVDGGDHPGININIDGLSADMSAWYAEWQNIEFNQGSPDAVISDDGGGEYTIRWSSYISTDPFKGKTGDWTLTVTPINDPGAPPLVVNKLAAPIITAMQGGVPTHVISTTGGMVTLTSGTSYPDAQNIFWGSAGDSVTGISDPATPGHPFMFDPFDDKVRYVPDPSNPNWPVGALLADGVDILFNSLDKTYTLRVDGLGDPILDDEGVQFNDETLRITATSAISLVLRHDGADLAMLGLGDEDGDGVSNVDDVIDNTVTPNVQQVALGDAINVMTSQVGTSLSVGSAALCAGTAANMTLAQLAASGGPGCSEVSNNQLQSTLAIQSGFGGYYDFVVNGLSLGDTAYVTLPVAGGLPINAFYQKFKGNIWAPFVLTKLDDNVEVEHGKIFSTLSVGGGVCPAVPADPALDPSPYTSGLKTGDDCVLLAIIDGGENDADNQANGVVKDPGTFGSLDGTPVADVGAGGCTLSTETTSPFKHAEWLLLGGAVGWMAMRRRRQQKLH